MEEFTKITSVAIPLDLINVDTDMIIPKQFLKTIKRTGLGKNLFHEMRYFEDGSERTEFILNQPAYRNAKILIGGENFGCGSSREHAPWAILDFGIRCIIAPSFADIFYNNCFKNGILPVKLTKGEVKRLIEDAKAGDNSRISVDLTLQTISTYNGDTINFVIDPFKRGCLLNGWDDIGLTMKNEQKIADFEIKRKAFPWLSTRNNVT
ncbi:MAG: 3-isopropylmalate dehydratase small subunit [Magnetovibrio sp.]|nr:3-isopropylmalate dehydratase small subunit [Magnetovibrio sp.]